MQRIRQNTLVSLWTLYSATQTTDLPEAAHLITSSISHFSINASERTEDCGLDALVICVGLRASQYPSADRTLFTPYIIKTGLGEPGIQQNHSTAP
jgi:hypothetical protein